MTRSSGDKQLPVVLPGEIARGRRVFEENCQQCHGATGHGGSVGYRNVAPELMSAAPQVVADAVRMGPDVMPRFGPKTIDDASLGDVIAYIQYLQRFQYNPGGLQLANLGPVAEGFIAWTVGIGLLVLFVRRIGTTE
jgi:ubiquinol-cytochrome c reductase cytochrome c subunit